MDFSWIGNKKKTADMALDIQKRNADPIYISERTIYLDSLLPVIEKQLRETASWQMPQGITANESVAVCLALNITEAFSNHTVQFLLVSPWLQAWVLKKWRMERFIGQRIGFTE